jgi:hypothetical protein
VSAGHAERQRQKLYTDIWHVVVIAVSAVKGDWVGGGSVAWGRDKSTPVVPCLTEGGPLLAEQTLSEFLTAFAHLFSLTTLDAQRL